jgi:hypothetical protein
MQANRIFGDRQRDARSAELGRMHVAVHPDARTRIVRIRADRQDPQVAARGGLADRFEAHDLRVRGRPGADLHRQFIVVEVLLAKNAGHGRFTAR